MKFEAPEYYENRELSWLAFNQRILNEARDKSLPVLNRMKFLAITASNMDEFFMVRVASLKDMVNAGYDKPDLAGLTPQQQLDAIHLRAHDFYAQQYSTWNRSLVPILKKEKLVILESHEELNEKQAAFVDSYFEDTVYPVLTPMAVDASRPFPLIVNKSLNIAALLANRKKGSKLLKAKKTDSRKYDFATVQVPSVLDRLVEIPGENGAEHTFILLEQIIERNLSKLFKNYDVVCAHPYRVMRNADLPIDEDDASDLLKEIQKQLKRRQWGEVIRIEVEEKMDGRLLKILQKNLDVQKEAIYPCGGPVDLTFAMKLAGIDGYDHLRVKPFTPTLAERFTAGKDLFEEIKKGDILMHHPYESFDPVVNFIRQAAVDKDVLAIKQTLYRVSGNSPIIAALAQAAELGKQVTVLVELKARFDEEHNIVWAKRLEQAGCHVIYGLVGLKTHCKIALVVRREEDGIKRYVHLGTGNYNDTTAKIYTDCGLFTVAELIGEDATAVFNMLSGYSEPEVWNRLVAAPIWLRKKFYALIDREIRIAKEGRPAKIIAKMNSLCDQKLIERLYEASSAGVKIRLVVRGICCLKTGIAGVSDNIEVSSIVGEFLEHSRIFYFYNDGQEDIYMGSADWMPRNLDRRVELIFPLEDESVRAKAKHILEVLLSDNKKAYYLNDKGEYERLDKRGKKLLSAQETFCREALKSQKKEEKTRIDRVFVPVKAVEE
ncbi:MAG: RNA degradosome polyphosphate kinase [Lachnospiraceae bacterium]|nr:RNA degradosome polyphosphate kinase [Lachnospiraceae bacterium]